MIVRTVLVLLAAVCAAAASADEVKLTNERTGETFSYTPSFARQPTAERPITDRVYDPNERRWVTYRETTAHMRKRQRALYKRTTVSFVSAEPAGTVVVDTAARFLYFVLPDGLAIRYGIGVGREGFSWSGIERVSDKREWPDWTPPAEMRERQPFLPDWMPGGPDNPLGAAALYLGNTLYRIHGTNEADSIGSAVSSGCIRMTNADIEDLYARVTLGTRVIVLGPGSDRSGLLAALSPF